MTADHALRIAHLIETDGPGGAERMLAHLATSLQAAGHYNVVCVPADGEGWIANELAASGVAIEPVRLLGAPMLKSIRELTQVFRHHHIQIAQSHEFTMAVYGAGAARWAGIPHVVTMHGSRYYVERWRRRLALRAAVALSGRLVAVSGSLGDHLSRHLRIRRSRIAMIPNGVPPVAKGSSTLPQELQLKPTDRLLVAVGNLYPVKGHLVLLEAFASLSARYASAHLAIAGRGALDSELRKRASVLGIGRQVHWLGLRSDVANVLAAADVYVLPSLSEGLPLSLLEAMWAGCPIVASAVGEVPTALADGSAGLLVPAGDADALAAAVSSLLDNPSRAALLGARAHARAAAEYGLTRMVSRYMALYRALLGRALRDEPRDPAGNSSPRSVSRVT